MVVAIPFMEHLLWQLREIFLPERLSPSPLLQLRLRPSLKEASEEDGMLFRLWMRSSCSCDRKSPAPALRFYWRRLLVCVPLTLLSCHCKPGNRLALLVLVN